MTRGKPYKEKFYMGKNPKVTAIKYRDEGHKLHMKQIGYVRMV